MIIIQYNMILIDIITYIITPNYDIMISDWLIDLFIYISQLLGFSLATGSRTQPITFPFPAHYRIAKLQKCTKRESARGTGV